MSDGLELGREGYLDWPATLESLNTIAAAGVPVTLAPARRAASGRLSLTAEGSDAHLRIDGEHGLTVDTEKSAVAGGADRLAPNSGSSISTSASAAPSRFASRQTQRRDAEAAKRQ